MPQVHPANFFSRQRLLLQSSQLPEPGTEIHGVVWAQGCGAAPDHPKPGYPAAQQQKVEPHQIPTWKTSRETVNHAGKLKQPDFIMSLSMCTSQKSLPMLGPCSRAVPSYMWRSPVAQGCSASNPSHSPKWARLCGAVPLNEAGQAATEEFRDVDKNRGDEPESRGHLMHLGS